jgi:hypothetical protein
MYQAFNIVPVAALASAIEETVRETPEGAPMGPLYLAFVQAGLGADSFNSAVAYLIEAGKVTQSNNQLFPVA